MGTCQAEQLLTSRQTKDVHQDSVTVLSLERTLTDSFSTASNLYRNFGKRSKSVGDENGERHRRPLRKRRDSSSDSDSHHRLRRLRSRSRRREGDSNSDEELEHFSVASIRAEYDHGYGRFGEKFAVGDRMFFSMPAEAGCISGGSQLYSVSAEPATSADNCNATGHHQCIPIG